MRPYRGKTKDGKWVKGWYVKAKCDVHLIVMDTNYFYESGETDISIDCPVITGNIFEVIPETVGESTGLKDKNGVEIFEGDIVKDMSGRLHTIKYSTVGDTAGQFAYGDNIGMDYPYHMEVIGTIHDNPELLGDN